MFLSLALLLCPSLRPFFRWSPCDSFQYSVSPPNPKMFAVLFLELLSQLPEMSQCSFAILISIAMLVVFGCQGTACHMGDGVGKAYGSANDTVGNVWHQVGPIPSYLCIFSPTSQPTLTYSTFTPSRLSTVHRFELSIPALRCFRGSNWKGLDSWAG